MQRTALRDLVHTSLRPTHDKSEFLDLEFSLAVFDAAANLAVEAVSGCGLGLDLHAGERVLAAMISRETPREHEHRLVTAITDRRTLIAGYSSTKGGLNDRHHSIPHVELVNVEVENKMLKKLVTLVSTRGRFELPYAQVLDQLGNFYRALIASIPPDQRREPPTAFVDVSSDPSGVQSAQAGLWYADPEAQQMLAAVAHAHASGTYDANTAHDLACRITLAHRARISGPGAAGQAWMSALSSADLCAVVTQNLGYPTAQYPAQNGQIYDFRIDPRRRPFVTAGSVAGAVAYATIGIGFNPGKVIGQAIANQMLQREDVTLLRLTCGDTTSGSWYQIQANTGRPLEHIDAMMALDLHRTLIQQAYPILGRRAHVGWGPSLQEMFAQG